LPSLISSSVSLPRSLAMPLGDLHLRTPSHARAEGDDTKAVVLDLVQPVAAGRQFIGFW
jgi:hypothetical protein